MTARDVPLEEKVRFLSDPRAYQDGTTRVERVETHMAFVFLTAENAWKMKKPVRYPFLDFSTLAARGRTCLEEVRLNRRLASHVYLGVAPLTRENGGDLAVDGSGVPVEWLVRMRRLPAHRMLDRAIGAGAVEPGDLGAVADLLAAFYRDAPPALSLPDLYRDHFRREVARTRRELLEPVFGLPEETVRSLAAGHLEFLRRRGGLLDRRADEGRIVEGHGDLRPEHVHLGPPPVVIDCIEFDVALRTLDPAEDLAFLWLECEQLGAGWVGEEVLDGYVRGTGDRPADELLDFYRSFRAFIRAKLAVRHLLDRATDDREEWRSRALTYLELGHRHLPTA